MKDRSSSHGQGRLVVTPKNVNRGLRNAKLYKKHLQPCEFCSGVGKRSVLNLSRRPRLSGLLLGGPRDKIVTEKDAKPGGRPLVDEIANPIRISISIELKRTGSEDKTIRESALYIA